MPQMIILGILGLIFFLLGTFELSRIVQKIFNFRIRHYLYSWEKNRFFGPIFGFILAVLFQSSSAAIVLVVMLVNAGILSFAGSLPIILGAGIGTTITPALVALKITNIAPIFIILGGFLYLFSKKNKWRIFGQGFLFFGLLFFGLALIGQAAKPLADSPFFIQAFEKEMSPFLGLGLSTFFTAIVQASAIPISILIALSEEGTISLASALPIILGANIGTTVTALLASLKGNLLAKRTAVSHLFFKVIGTLLIFPFLGFFVSFLESIFPSLAGQIVGAHFFFNVFLLLIFIFLLKPVSKLMEKIIPGQEKVLPLWPIYLDKKLVSNPNKALLAVEKELLRTTLLVKEMFGQVKKLLSHFELSLFERINYIELVVDEMQQEILEFFDSLEKEKLSRKDAQKIICLANVVDEIERIGDRIVNVAKLSQLKKEKKVVFSQEAEKEIEEIFSYWKKILLF